MHLKKKIVMSGGAGGKMDPTKLIVADLAEYL
jgi:tRNA A37 threonylcarbamoyladenosine dehydratase